MARNFQGGPGHSAGAAQPLVAPVRSLQRRARPPVERPCGALQLMHPPHAARPFKTQKDTDDEEEGVQGRGASNAFRISSKTSTRAPSQ